MATNEKKNEKKAVDLTEFFGSLKEKNADAFENLQVKKVNHFNGDVVKMINHVGAVYQRKFIAPKGWDVEAVESLVRLFDVFRESAKIFKDISVSDVRTRKDGSISVDFESTKPEAFIAKIKIGDEKSEVSLVDFIKQIVSSQEIDDASSIENRNFRNNKIAKISLTFDDVDENRPLELGEKGLVGLFLINDLQSPYTKNKKTGKDLYNKVNAELLLNFTKLPENIQVDVKKLPRYHDYLSVKNFKFDDTVVIRRALNYTLNAIAFDILDIQETTEKVVIEDEKGKKKEVDQKINLFKLGFHVCSVNYKDGKIIVDNCGSERNGETNFVRFEKGLSDILNEFIDEKYRKYVDSVDENGKKHFRLVSDRIFDDTNLVDVAAAIDTVLERAASAEITNDDDCIFTRRVKYERPFTIGDAVENSTEEEGEFSPEEEVEEVTDDADGVEQQ